jgi:release factor glutamine methyltransferase
VSLPPTWRSVLAEATDRLRSAGVEDAARNARLLLADALGTDVAGLIARERDAPDARLLATLETMLERRCAGEPVSRIRGWKEFYGRRFIVTPDVLDPRPETELLVEMALAACPSNGRVLDLGVGSGCVLLSILAERADIFGMGVDVSTQALDVADRNMRELGLANRARLQSGDWSSAGRNGTWDVVVSNPPYIPSQDLAGLDREVREHDPQLALDGGRDGLDAYRALSPAAHDGLVPGGWVLLEVGAGQSDAVQALLAGAGFQTVGARRDLGGHERVVSGRKPLLDKHG